MMRQEFKRKMVIPIIFLVTAIIALINVILQLALGQMALAGLWSVITIMFFINAIWNISTAFIIIENGTLYIKDALLKQRECVLTDIERIDFTDEKRIEVYLKNKTQLTIRLNSMALESKEELINFMTAFHKTHAAQQL